MYAMSDISPFNNIKFQLQAESSALPNQVDRESNVRCPNATPLATSTTRRNARAADATTEESRIQTGSSARPQDVKLDVPSTTTHCHVHRANAEVRTKSNARPPDVTWDVASTTTPIHVRPAIAIIRIKASAHHPAVDVGALSFTARRPAPVASAGGTATIGHSRSVLRRGAAKDAP